MSKRALRRRQAADHAAGFVDARNLVGEIARIHPAGSVDPKAAGLILHHGESVRRAVGMWMRQALINGTWSTPTWTSVFVTDQRLILRPAGGGLAMIWWGHLVGFEANLTTGHVSFDFGNGAITLLSGPGAAVLAVAGIYVLYGGEGLRDHPALQPIRDAEYLSNI